MDRLDREKYFKLCMDITNKNIDVKDKKEIAIIMISYLQTYLISPFIEEKEKEYRSELNYNNKGPIKKQIDIAKKILTYITIDDPNCVGKVNIISLQFVILLTTIWWPYNEPFKHDINDNYRNYKFILSTNWTDYNSLKTALNDKQSGRFKQLYYGNYEDINDIFLITILDYLRLDEIINTFLDNIFICGISTKMIYADGRELTPFEFLEHDITHASNYKGYCFIRMQLNVEGLKNFLAFVNENTEFDKAKKYSIKVIIFLLIHEAMCDFFWSPGLTYAQVNRELSYQIMKRLQDTNDLGELIPKSYRESRIEEYIEMCVKNYVDALKQFFEPAAKGGKSIRKRKSKRKYVSKSMTKKKGAKY
jgi:hypothetical protein